MNEGTAVLCGFVSFFLMICFLVGLGVYEDTTQSDFETCMEGCILASSSRVGCVEACSMFVECDATKKAVNDKEINKYWVDGGWVTTNE